MKKLMLFDLDGTLFNTNEVNYYAYKQALNDEGADVEHDRFIKEYNGRSYKYFLPLILKQNDDKIIDRIHNNKKNYYKNYLGKAKENISLFSIIEHCKKDYHIAIVTTASKENTLDLLKYFNRTELFDCIISAEDYKNPKPDPEAFLLAIDKFKMDTKNVIIFEDSSVGIEAALKTGASVYKIENF